VLLLAWHPHALRERPWMAPLVGLLSGTASTATGMAGPPLVLFFTLMTVGKQTFRATAAMYFITLDLVGLPTLIGQGSVSGGDLRLALALAPVAVIGRLLGARLVPYVSPLAFRRATLGLLLVTGTVSMGTGLMGLV
ncbi:MAG: sulfite exporter TauE/SafE family protein, partial [Chloroflexota bacterium]|nr:sulfite exporter TauE/SafE family protein [Chloroflexota bacterium]